MANQLGKRYQCEVCGTQVLCTKAGAGEAGCCSQELVIQQQQKVPSAD